jgi:hypothetical protein
MTKHLDDLHACDLNNGAHTGQIVDRAKISIDVRGGQAHSLKARVSMTWPTKSG